MVIVGGGCAIDRLRDIAWVKAAVDNECGPSFCSQVRHNCAVNVAI